MSVLTEETDGWLVSEFRAPRNQHQKLDNSIHNDDVAKPLGFRGGTVAGIIHHEQFAPVLLEIFDALAATPGRVGHGIVAECDG